MRSAINAAAGGGAATGATGFGGGGGSGGGGGGLKMEMKEKEEGGGKVEGKTEEETKRETGGGGGGGDGDGGEGGRVSYVEVLEEIQMRMRSLFLRFFVRFLHKYREYMSDTNEVFDLGFDAKVRATDTFH